MHTQRLLWLLWLGLGFFAAIYLATFRLLVDATRRRVAAGPEMAAVRHGHLILLRPPPAQERAQADPPARSPRERRGRSL